MPRKPRTAAQLAEAGYVERAAAAKALRQMATDLEEKQDGQLVKFSITFWFAESAPRESSA